MKAIRSQKQQQQQHTDKKKNIYFYQLENVLDGYSVAVYATYGRRKGKFPIA